MSEERVRWYKGCWVGFGQAMKALHCGAKPLQRIIEKEGIEVIRIRANRHVWSFISPDDFRKLLIKHGTDAARESRMESWRGKPNPSQISMACPRCGKSGKMYRQKHHTTAGNTVLQCGYCRASHTFNSTRRPPLKATCPHCSATTGQWRKGFTSAGNRVVKCKHCRKNYTLKDDPEHVPPPKWVNPRRLTPEEEIVELRKRLAAGPTDWEIELHARRTLAELEYHSDRRIAEMEERARKCDRELAAMKALDKVQEIAINAITRRPPRPGEPPRMDPETAWEWLSESRQAIIEEYLTPQPTTTLDRLRALAESEQNEAIAPAG